MTSSPDSSPHDSFTRFPCLFGHLAHRQRGPFAHVDVLKEATALIIDPSCKGIQKRCFLGRRNAITDLSPVMLELELGLAQPERDKLQATLRRIKLQPATLIWTSAIALSRMGAVCSFQIDGAPAISFASVA